MGSLRDLFSRGTREMANLERGRRSAAMARRRKRTLLPFERRQTQRSPGQDRSQLRRWYSGSTLSSQSAGTGRDLRAVFLRRHQRRAEIPHQYAAEVGHIAHVCSVELECEAEVGESDAEVARESSVTFGSGAVWPRSHLCHPE